MKSGAEKSGGCSSSRLGPFPSEFDESRFQGLGSIVFDKFKDRKFVP